MQKRLTPYPLIALLCILILAACASIGSPDGGPRDFTPPKVPTGQYVGKQPG